jgi:hypothetical protein
VAAVLAAVEADAADVKRVAAEVRHLRVSLIGPD